MANLFEISTDDDLSQTPDGYYLYGVPGHILDTLGELSTMLYEDVENGTVVAANGDIIGYGTEIGTFLRLDDLKPGAAFINIDRGIFMNTGRGNACIEVPLNSLQKIAAEMDI